MSEINNYYFSAGNLNKGELLGEIDKATDMDWFFSEKDKINVMQSAIVLLYWNEWFNGIEEHSALDEGNLYAIFELLKEKGDFWEKAINYLCKEFEYNWVDLIAEIDSKSDELADSMGRSHLVYADLIKNKKWEYDVPFKAAGIREAPLSWLEEKALSVKSAVVSMIWTASEVISYFTWWNSKEYIEEFKKEVKSSLWNLIAENSDSLPDEIVNISNYTMIETEKESYQQEKESRKSARQREERDKLYHSGYKIIDTFKGEGDLNCMLTEDSKWNLALTVRWTESLGDVGADIELLTWNIPTQLYELNEYFVKQVIPKLTDENGNERKIIVEGHSLWGWLAEMLLYVHPDKFEKSRSFNAPAVWQILTWQIDYLINQFHREKMDSIRLHWWEVDLSKIYWKDDIIWKRFLQYVERNCGLENINDVKISDLYRFKREYLNKITSKVNWYSSESSNLLNDTIVSGFWEKLEEDIKIKWVTKHSIFELSKEFKSNQDDIANALKRSNNLSEYVDSFDVWGGGISTLDLKANFWNDTSSKVLS